MVCGRKELSDAAPPVVPLALLEKIQTAEHACVYPVLLYILHKDQRHPGVLLHRGRI
jgi:hypothetical protein